MAKNGFYFSKSIQSFHIGQVWFIIAFYLPLKLNLMYFSSHVPEKFIKKKIVRQVVISAVLYLNSQILL